MYPEQRSSDQQVDVQLPRRGQDAVGRVALFVVDVGIRRQFKLGHGFREFARCRRIVFANVNHVQIRAEARANTVRLRQNRMKSRRKRGRDRNRPVWRYSQHWREFGSGASRGQIEG